MYYRNGFFSSIGGFFKKVVNAPLNIAKGIVGGATSLVGGAIKGLGITSISTPFGSITTAPSGVPSGSQGYSMPVNVQATGGSLLEGLGKYLPFILIGVVGLIIFLVMKK